MLLARSQFTFPRVSVNAGGVLLLSFKGLQAGRVTALATFKLARVVVERVKGVRHHVRKLEAITYGTVAESFTRAGNSTLMLKPGRRALALLKAHHCLHVALRVTFRATGELASLPQARTLLVTYRKPPPPKRHR
jgi:hypothetical protein